MEQNSKRQSVNQKRILSGVQPSGQLTLGNYLGAIKRFVDLQDAPEEALGTAVGEEGVQTIYCIADLHAITVWQDPQVLRQQVRSVTAAYLAAGLNPEKSIIFNQSRVSAHAELAWIFNCVARLGWLDRMTQFKDKVGKNKEKASVGLYAYPTLMASDILLYKSDAVPVGEDQKQHLELTRDIAQKFNHDYGCDFFGPVSPLILGKNQGARIMSLRDGTKKMSKSDPSDYSRLNLTDDVDTIAKKIRKAKTDAEPLPDASVLEEGAFNAEIFQERPEAVNLLNIYSVLEGESLAQTLTLWGGRSFKDFKEALTETAVSHIGPLSEKIRDLETQEDYLDKILAQGALRAKEIADPILEEVYQIVGLR